MRSIGLAALTVLDVQQAEQVTIAAQAGYDAVGLRILPSTAGDPPRPVVEKELAARLRDTGLKVLDIEIFRLEPGTRVAEYEPSIALGARLGATDMLVAANDPDEARLAERFGELCDLAARYGLSPSLEPMPWIAVSTVAKAKRIAALAGRKNGAVLVDAIHFFRGDNRFADLQGAPLRYAQLCDARAEKPADLQEVIRQARGDRLFPGEGGLDLKGLLAALPINLPVSLEIPVALRLPPLERARRALQAARRVLAGA